ncbi:MAG: DUF58 domain-containing protein [Chitinophagaceae bacterium]
MSKLLDPKVLIAIKDLSLAAKTTIDGFMEGINKSVIKGPGMEFSQYRSYQPGDDLRSLDWKMFARSDRYYIRESEVETSISVRFLIDASNSMNHEDGGYTKIEYAKYLAASLAYLSSLQGDAVGLYVMQKGNVFSLSSKRDKQHLSRFFYFLETIKPSGNFVEPVQYKNIFNSNTRRELLIFITDFYEQHDEIMQMLYSLVSLKHEIVVFTLLGRNEQDLDYSGYTKLEDLETGETVSIGEGAAKKLYQQQLEDRLTLIRKQMLNKNIFHRVLTMDEPLDKALRDFLNQRNKIRG